MKNVDKIIEIEALSENVMKHFAKNNLLKFKVLYFISQYQNLSVGMIIDKLGLKKSNFALMTKILESDGLVESKQGEIDKRCRLMSLTEKGKTQLQEFQNDMEKFFHENSPEVEHAIETICNYLNKKV